MNAEPRLSRWAHLAYEGGYLFTVKHTLEGECIGFGSEVLTLGAYFFIEKA